MVASNIFTSILLVTLFIILYFRKENALPNKLLAITVLIPSFNFLNNILILTGGIYIFPWSYFFVQLTGTLFAPFAYYYVLSMTGRTRARSLQFLVPISGLIIAYAIYITVGFALLDKSGQQVYLDRVINGPYPDDMIIYSAALFIHQLLYFSVSALHVYRYKRDKMVVFSNLGSIKYEYLSRFVGLLWLLTLLTVIAYSTVETVYVEYIILPIVLVVIFIFIVFYAFNQNAIFTSTEFLEYQSKTESSDTPKETLSAEELEKVENALEAQNLYTELINIIHSESLYTQPDIHIDTLSNLLDVPVYRLVSSIKSHGTTFYELIRQIRVQKAKEFLEDKNCDFTIERIAYEVGFNSRASFYRAYSKYEKKSPSASMARK